MTKGIAEDVTFLTAQQLCKRWQGCISEKTLANWRSDNKGPRYKRFGSRIVYTLESVREWEAAQDHSSTSEYSLRKEGRTPIGA